MPRTVPIICLVLAAGMLFGCGEGASGGDTPAPPDSAGRIDVSGQVTFARVPFDADSIGLNYAGEFPVPVRWADVVALNADGLQIANTRTDDAGRYALSVPENALFRIEVLARSIEPGAALRWNLEVRNNRAAGDPVYRLAGEQLNSGSTDLVVDLHAASGWDGSNYSNPRSAAPFAILDSISTIHQKMMQAGVSLDLGSLDVHWSPLNSNTSFYDFGGNFIEILGDEDSDTDEYDQHVIVHEWRHYFEAQVSRGDVIGGSHSSAVPLELRTAYSEGVANAWSAYILDDPIYKDSAGAGQQFGFTVDIESQFLADPGWYNEGSVEQIVYDMLDTANEPSDNLAIGLDELIQLWMDENYLEKVSFTGLQALEAAVADVLPGYSADLRTLVDSMQVQGQGYFAENETDQPAGLDYVLPVYRQMQPDDPGAEICSHNEEGEYNRLQNRQLAQLQVDQPGTFTLRLVYSDVVTRNEAGLTLAESLSLGAQTDPDFVIYSRGEALSGTALVGPNFSEESISNFGKSAISGEERGRIDLTAGTYVVDMYDYYNVDQDLSSGGLRCFVFTVVRD